MNGLKKMTTEDLIFGLVVRAEKMTGKVKKAEDYVIK